ncbi:Surface polysaccharide O-acyltransferase, integral membrane enzyme [Lachnospiraceae bacterium XBB2008]|nr:Surface polysaccharide O-acyltransferase, integral membrane enzyme [Lachnospiraceae bacterium XBB2008]
MSEGAKTTVTTQSPAGREYYMDIARVLSMVSVIMIHVGAITWYDGPFSIYPWGVTNLFDILSRYCVPVFLMMSGYLFLDPNRNISVRKMYTRYLPRLLAAFFFWSFLYAIITSGFLTQRTFSEEVVSKFIHNLFFGHYHMWYMYIIVGMYIITPALRGLVKDRQALRYFLIAAYVISYLIPNIMMLPHIYEHVGLYFNRLEFAFVSGYVFYYAAGYYVATEEFTDKQKKLIYLLGLIGLLGTVITMTTYVLVTQYPNSVYHEYYTAGIPLYSIAVFIFFRDRFANVDPQSKPMKVIMWLSRLSFGVYMAHDFGLIVFKKLGLVTTMCTPFISMPLLTLMDLAITVFIVWVVSLIPGLKKWVI